MVRAPELEVVISTESGGCGRRARAQRKVKRDYKVKSHNVKHYLQICMNLLEQRTGVEFYFVINGLREGFYSAEFHLEI